MVSKIQGHAFEVSRCMLKLDSCVTNLQTNIIISNYFYSDLILDLKVYILRYIRKCFLGCGRWYCSFEAPLLL